MTSKFRSRRYAKRVAGRSKRNFIATFIIIAILLYATLQWILPNFIGGIGFITGKLKPASKTPTQDTAINTSLAPPVLSIPYEATNTAQISIKGYGDPHSKVEIFLDDDKKDTAQVSEDGSFEFQNIDLSLGTNNIYGKSVDDSGKESLASKTIQVIYDNEKPSLDVSQPSDGQTIQGGDKKVTVSGKTEPDAQVLVNGSQVVVDKDGNFSTTIDINDGDNNITIRATDQAGNYTEVVRKVTYKS